MLLRSYRYHIPVLYILTGAGLQLGCEASAEVKRPPVTGVSEDSIGGRGAFSYRCAGASDPYCADNTLFTSSGIPVMAVGATADFRFKRYGGNEVPVQDVVSKTRLKLGTGGRVTVESEGKAGILAFDDPKGGPVDAFNLTARPHAKLRLEALSGKLGFHVWPEDATGKPLAGALPCAWTIDDPNVATITTDPASTVVVLEAKANGKTTLHLAYAGTTQTIPVEVNR